MKTIVLYMLFSITMLYAETLQEKVAKLEKLKADLKQKEIVLKQNSEKISEHINQNIKEPINSSSLSENTLDIISKDQDYIFIKNVLEFKYGTEFSADANIKNIASQKIMELINKYRRSDIYTLLDLVNNIETFDDNILSKVSINNDLGANLREHPIMDLSPKILIANRDLKKNVKVTMLKYISFINNSSETVQWAKVMTEKGIVGWIYIPLTNYKSER